MALQDLINDINQAYETKDSRPGWGAAYCDNIACALWAAYKLKHGAYNRDIELVYSRMQTLYGISFLTATALVHGFEESGSAYYSSLPDGEAKTAYEAGKALRDKWDPVDMYPMLISSKGD